MTARQAHQARLGAALSRDHPGSALFHDSSLVNKTKGYMDRLKEDSRSYGYETNDLFEDIPKDEVMKDELYAIKAIAVDNYRILLIFSRENIHQGKITREDITAQRNTAFKNFVKAERHLTSFRGILIQHFIDQFKHVNDDNPRPDTLLKSITSGVYHSEDDKLEYMIEFYANETDGLTNISTSVIPHAIRKKAHTTGKISIFATNNWKDVIEVMQQFHLYEKDLPSEMSDSKKNQHLTKACQNIIENLKHTNMGLSFPNVFDDSFADVSLSSNETHKGRTDDNETYECSISAQTVQLTVTKAWCHPIVVDKINRDMQATQKGITHIQLLAKLKSGTKEYELKWVILPYKTRKACVTFLYNQSPNQSLLSIKNNFENTNALTMNTKKLFVDSKELDKFEEFNLWRFHSMLCHDNFSSMAYTEDNSAYLFKSKQVTVLASCHKIHGTPDTCTAYTIIQWLPDLSHVDHSLHESKKITVLQKHIHDMESRLTMATSVRKDPLCSEVVPGIIKDSMTGYYIIAQTRQLDIQVLEEKIRDIEEEIIKSFSRFVNSLKLQYKEEAAEKGFKPPKTDRQILNRYCCDVWKQGQENHEWAKMETSLYYPYVRYPTQYPGLVINFLRTLKEQIHRAQKDPTKFKMVESFELLHINIQRIDDTLLKLSNDIRFYVAQNAEKFTQFQWHSNKELADQISEAKNKKKTSPLQEEFKAARNDSRDRALETKVKLKNLRLHERMQKSGYVSTPQRVSVPQRPPHTAHPHAPAHSAHPPAAVHSAHPPTGRGGPHPFTRTPARGHPGGGYRGRGRGRGRGH